MQVLVCCGCQEVSFPNPEGPYSLWAVSRAAVDLAGGKERQMRRAVLPPCLRPHCQCVSVLSTEYTGKLIHFDNGFGCKISFPQAEGSYQFGERKFTNCEDLSNEYFFTPIMCKALYQAPQRTHASSSRFTMAQRITI